MKYLFPLLIAGACVVNVGCNSANQSDSNASDSTSTVDTIASSAFPEEEFGWKLGAQAYTFRLFSLEEALGKIKSAGLRYVELYPGQQFLKDNETLKVDHTLSAEDRAKLTTLLSDNGITVAGYGVVDGKDEAEWRQIFEFAKDLSIPTIVCEPKEEHLDIISALCDEFDIKAALHNHPDPSHYWNPETVIKAYTGRSANIGAAADVGHWVRSGLDPIECLKKLEGKIYHMHFKDLNEANNKEAHDVNWGTGVIGMDNIISELKRQNYKGMISAEYEYNWENNTEDVRNSVANFRAAL